MTRRLVRAPGRVNLIGEHTDYNGGFVLPMAIDREVTLTAERLDERRVEIRSGGEEVSFGLPVPTASAARSAVRGQPSWGEHAAGIAWSLREAELEPLGLRATVESDLPAGAGLSSSAAFALAVTWGLLEAPERVDPMRLARAAQRAEHEVVGVRSGIMDPAVVLVARADHALLLDCRSLETRHVPLPAEVAVVVIDSGASRSLAGSAYNQRRAECEAVVRLLAAGDPGIRSLRDVSMDLLAARGPELPAVLRRRARHVVSENARVLEVVAAFEAGDLGRAGAALDASHASLRDDYEVSSAALDALVEIARDVPGVHGARLTGAGFGGCTVNLVAPDAVAALRAAVLERFEARTGLTPRVMPVRAVSGVGWASA